MKNRYGARRTTGTRSILPIIEVVCDDTRTAVAYFNLLKKEVAEERGPPLNTEPLLINGGPLSSAPGRARNQIASLHFSCGIRGFVAVMENFRPSARITRMIVPNSGLPSLLSAL